jgi:hypothetical protein
VPESYGKGTASCYKSRELTVLSLQTLVTFSGLD